MEHIPWLFDLDIDFEPSPRNRKTIKRATKPLIPQSECAFLSKVPAEIRTQIYTLAAQDDVPIDLEDDRICAPALGRVCRQLELEYSSVYMREAPRWCSLIRLHLTSPQRDLIAKTLACLSPPGPGTIRRYTKIFHLTNFHSLDRISGRIDLPSAPPTPQCLGGHDSVSSWHHHAPRTVVITDWQIWFDPRTFDVDFARTKVQAHYYWYDGIPQAFDDAVRRYARRGALGVGPRKRVRSSKVGKSKGGKMVKIKSNLKRK